MVVQPIFYVIFLVYHSGVLEGGGSELGLKVYLGEFVSCPAQVLLRFSLVIYIYASLAQSLTYSVLHIKAQFLLMLIRCGIIRTV